MPLRLEEVGIAVGDFDATIIFFTVPGLSILGPGSVTRVLAVEGRA